MSRREKELGAEAFGAGKKRADNPYGTGTDEWMDWKDGFEQAKAGQEREDASERLAETL